MIQSKILIVEDNRIVARDIQQQLARIAMLQSASPPGVKTSRRWCWRTGPTSC